MSAGHFLRVGRVGFHKTGRVGAGAALVAARHNLRAIQAELGCDSHIDASRVHLNLILHGADTPDGVAAAWASLTASNGIHDVRKNACAALEAVCSLPVHHGVDAEAYFRDCLQWLAGRFGGLGNVISAVVHNDEAQPHMHALIVPLVAKDGGGVKLSADEAMGDRGAVKAMNDAFWLGVAKRYGLRQSVALRGATKAAAVKLVLEHMKRSNDPAMRSSMWPQLRACIEANPAPFAEAIGGEALAPKKKRMRSSTAIFTSPGKGPKREREVFALPY